MQVREHCRRGTLEGGFKEKPVLAYQASFPKCNQTSLLKLIECIQQVCPGLVKHPLNSIQRCILPENSTPLQNAT
jgi:hypothetical protein